MVDQSSYHLKGIWKPDTDPWSLGQWLVLATFKNLPTEQVQPDKAALLSAGPVLVRVTLKSKLARLLSIYPILKPKIQAWTLYKDHKFLHQFVKFCRKGRFCIFVLNIFPQFYASVYWFFSRQTFTYFPTNLCINLSNFVATDVYALLLKSNPGDFCPIQSWAKIWVPVLCCLLSALQIHRSCVVCCLLCKTPQCGYMYKRQTADNTGPVHTLMLLGG